MRAALITGGSSGIGLAIARMLRDDGFELTLSARTPEKLESAANELGAHAVIANVADDEDCERLVEDHKEQFGRLDVLVNSAGVGLGGPSEQMSTKKWDLQLDVNLRGTFVVTRAAIPLLRESHGLVVNLASIAGTLPVPGLAAGAGFPGVGGGPWGNRPWVRAAATRGGRRARAPPRAATSRADPRRRA